MTSTLAFLAVTLSIIACPEPGPDGVVRGCTVYECKDCYADHAICAAIADRRHGEGQWKQDGRDFVHPGWTIKIDCHPMYEFIVPEPGR